MLKRKELAAGLSLLAFVSGLCLAGLKAIDKKLAEKKAGNGNG
jgi:hypothetical protein